jgi:hypothetical protein
MPSDLINSVGESAPVNGVDAGLDSMGRGNAASIEGKKVVLTVDLPHGDPGIISGPGWSPSR